MGKLKSRLVNQLLATLLRTACQPRVARQIFYALASDRDVVIPGHTDKGEDGDREHLRFFGFCLSNRECSNSQLLQDLWVAYETEWKRDGFFVEFGAVDGKIHSNTYFLEKSLGWLGILAEPNQSLENDLRKNRSAAIDMRCVWSRSGEHLEFLVTADPELSTLKDFAAEDAHSEARNSNFRTVVVETITLGDLLAVHNGPKYIDYMSVDTEGTELELLKTFDWHSYDIRLVSIEHNYRSDQAELDQMMFKNGYARRFRKFSNFDAWYKKID